MADTVPDRYEEHRIVITWTVGDSLTVDSGDLDEWEARAALEQAIELITSDVETDLPTE